MILSSKSLVARLLLVTGLALLPALLFQAHSVFDARGLREAAVREQALNLLRLVAGAQQQIVEGVRQGLSTLAAAPAFHTEDPTLCQMFLSRLLRNSPQFADAVSIGRDGRVVCAADRSGVHRV